MNQTSRYLCSVLLSLLLIFSLIGTAASLLVGQKALNAETCTELLESKDLSARVHKSLADYFKTQENTTGIPAETYDRAIAEDKLKVIINDSISNAFAYLHGDADKVETEPDFSELEADLTDFFNRYAEENGFEKDSKFDETLGNAIKSAKNNILISSDIFRVRTLADAGVMAKAKKAVPYVLPAEIGCIIADLLFIGLLFLLHRKQLRRAVYWLACAIFAASALLICPTLWIQKTQWFDRFSVKSDQIFAAVTGYLYGLTGAAIVIAVCGLIAAAVLWILCVTVKKSPKQNG